MVEKLTDVKLVNCRGHYEKWHFIDVLYITNTCLKYELKELKKRSSSNIWKLFPGIYVVFQEN